MENTGFCVRCKKNKVMTDTSMDKTSKGVPMLRGICSICGTKMTRMLRKDFEFEPSEPPSAPPLQPIEPPIKIPKEEPTFPRDDLPPIEVKDREKEIVEDYIEKANNNEILKRNGIKVGKDYVKWLVGVTVLFIVVFGYLAYNDKFSSTLGCGNNTYNGGNLTSICETICEEQTCNPTLVCNSTLICDFPSELEINLQNSS